MARRINGTADVDADAQIGEGSSIWHLAQVRSHASVGRNCVIGRGAYIGPGVSVGDNCKIQNYALVYEPSQLGNRVFVGPAAVLTNDTYPRAAKPNGDLKSADDWTAVGVVIGDGASIGARAVCVAPVRIGTWAMVAAGSVVANDVPNYALVAGVPARRIGWVSRTGQRLHANDDGSLVCPETGDRFQESDGVLAVLAS